MDSRFLIAILHILTFGLGTYSCWARARALSTLKNNDGLKDVFMADNLWGLAALLWIGSGLWRAFGGIEKGSEYYLDNTAFLIKMALFVVVFMLEVKPMATLIRWRIRMSRGQTIDLSSAALLSQITYVELALLVPIVLMAGAMARGIWY
jgi:putative membrane protein